MSKNNSKTQEPSRNRKSPNKKQLREHVPFSSPELKDPKLVSETLLKCIKTGELDSFRAVLASYLMTANKLQLAQKAGLGRRTLYDILDPKKKFNPELSTLSALIRAIGTNNPTLYATIKKGYEC